MRFRKNGGEGSSSCSWRFLTRKKKFDSDVNNNSHNGQLAKELSIPDLMAIGVGATIGAGVYVLVGTVAREHAGPALPLSFMVAGIAATLSALCYAELASKCPSAGSAYHYAYVCVGEGVAWLIGWSLMLEYGVSGAVVARGITPNLAALIGGVNNIPGFLSYQHIPWIDVDVDPLAAIVVLLVTWVLCTGIKESTRIQSIVTSVNICALMFVIVAGGYLGFKTGWIGYQLPTGYFPFGVDGTVAGSATAFLAYIGFDAVACTAEEVKNPQRDLPLGIGASLSLCCGLYMLVSIVIVGLVPYYDINPDTPLSSAFADNGMQWAAYIINAGAFTALCSSLLGGMLPQPRVLMTMARDGLLPPFFSDINEHSQVPVKSTIFTGLVAAVMAFFMDVSQLAGMVSVGALLAFTTAAISVLILTYIPPNEVPLPPSIDSESMDEYAWSHLETNEIDANKKPLVVKEDVSIYHPLISKHLAIGNYVHDGNKRKIVGFVIAFICLGVFILTFAASSTFFTSSIRFTLCGVGGALLLSGFVFLKCTDKDDARHNFGHSGGFTCPLVPLLPITSILINSYLLINLGGATWLRVSVWLAIGVIVYVFYGRTHSSLRDALNVKATHEVDDTSCTPTSFLA
ncbi:cationic amino acid transporter 2, vacuolar-like [Cicer arietinum]|uniref:Cationic amino acid transporter 2, vacuolar-like n=1 Tax=Cicer arietinum TaxID=3827 RepID=A0A1S2XJP9_CICAR|nr:cationic amino acid transporter 2, vacuolar-like [Cicer arietinum]